MPAAIERKSTLITTNQQPAVDRSILPPYDDDSLILGPANEAEYEQTSRINADEWKGFLDLETYLDRETYLNNSSQTGNGGMIPWVLTSSKLPGHEDGSRTILAACETSRKLAYVAKDGQLERVISHGIGSVYCRQEYRGRKYAEVMMRELGKRLETWQQPKSGKGKFSVLYSDIGPKFYAKTGWKPFPSRHITLKMINNAGEYHQRRAEITPLPDIKDLRLEDIASLKLEQSIEDKLISASRAEPKKTFVAFKPDLPQLEWHFMREDFLAEVLGREQPDIKGAIDARTGVAVIWVRTYAAEKSGWHLSILYTHVPHQTTLSHDDLQRSLSALLLRAQFEATKWDLIGGVEVWDPSALVVDATKAIAHGEDIRVIERDQEHICSLKWVGQEPKDVVWLQNERYVWC